MTEFFTAISNFGFPVVVAAYLLFRFENKIEKLEVSITGRGGLVDQISGLREAVEFLTREIDKITKKPK